MIVMRVAMPTEYQNTAEALVAAQRRDAAPLPSVRELANQAFSRASGAPLREGNRVRLLKDATENYPAWLDAIGAARRTIHFEMYIIHDDDQGQLFADALLRKAGEGVEVRLLYDWMGDSARPRAPSGGASGPA